MTVLVAKAVVDVVIVPLVQAVLWAEWVAVLGVVAFDLNTLSLLPSVQNILVCWDVIGM